MDPSDRLGLPGWQLPLFCREEDVEERNGEENEHSNQGIGSECGERCHSLNVPDHSQQTEEVEDQFHFDVYLNLLPRRGPIGQK